MLHFSESKMKGLYIPYLFGYKTGVSPLQNDYKYLNQLYVILL